MKTNRKGLRNGSWWLAAAWLLAACGDDADDTGGDAGDAAVVETPAADAGHCELSYASFGRTFLDTYCASCHAASVTGSARKGAPDDLTFETLADVQAAKAKLKTQVVTLKTMPFGTTKAFPSDDERAAFGRWLDCGPN